MLKLYKCISLSFINAYHYKCIPSTLEELNKSDCSKGPSAPIQSSTLWRLSRPIPAHATSPATHYKHGCSTHLAGLVNSVSASCWSRLRESAFSESSQRERPSSKTRKGVAPNVCKPCRISANRLIGLSILLQHSALRATVVQPHRAPDRLSRQATLAAGLEPAAPEITGGHPALLSYNNG